MARKKKSEEEIQNENEFLKMSLMAEFGGEFIDNNNLPAEIENRFLKEIQKFHRLQINTLPVIIYDLLGRPEYDHPNDLSDEEIEKRVLSFQMALAQKQIAVVTLSKVGNREFYRFIVEDVFKMETMEFKSKNFSMNIIYEDLYPSEEANVKISVLGACNTIFNSGMAAFPYVFAEDMKSKIGLTIELEELVDAISDFQEQFNQVTLTNSGTNDVVIYENTASAIAWVQYKTQTEKGKRFKKEESTLEFLLQKGDNGQWFVTQVVCAELRI